MQLTKLLIILILTGWCHDAANAQVRMNVNSPIMPSLNINGKKHQFKKEFKKIKRDSLAKIDHQVQRIEDELGRLEEAADQLTDSLSSVVGQPLADTSFIHIDSIHTDSIYQQLSHNEYLRGHFAEELDSVEHIKQVIQWDSLEESYVVQQMQAYFQSKGLLPPPATSPDPVAGFKQSLNEQNHLASLHLDPESFKNKEALSKEALKQLTRLKSKYVKIDDMRHPENGIEKPKPFNVLTDRLVFGGQIDLNIRKDPTIDVKPNVGMFLSKRIRLMFEYSATYFFKPRINFLERDEEHTQKLGTFLDVDVTRGFFARAKTEHALNQPMNKLSDLNYSVGLGKTITLYKGLKAQVVLNHSFQPNEHGRRWYLEYGIQQQGMSNLFQKKGK